MVKNTCYAERAKHTIRPEQRGMATDAHDLRHYGNRHRHPIHLVWFIHRPHAFATELLPMARHYPAQLLPADSGNQEVVHQEVWKVALDPPPLPPPITREGEFITLFYSKEYEEYFDDYSI